MLSTQVATVLGIPHKDILNKIEQILSEDEKSYIDYMINYDGTYLITMNGHITCAKNGVIYDTFDPSNMFIWGVYKV